MVAGGAPRVGEGGGLGWCREGQSTAGAMGLDGSVFLLGAGVGQVESAEMGGTWGGQHWFEEAQA